MIALRNSNSSLRIEGIADRSRVLNSWRWLPSFAMRSPLASSFVLENLCSLLRTLSNAQ